MPPRHFLLTLPAMLAACGAADAPDWAAFGAPVKVAIAGYGGDAMEPFVSRDGGTLLFNDRNGPNDATDLHWAVRTGSAKYRYMGRIAGANSSALDGVPTLAGTRLCFISPRAYAMTLATVHCGDWAQGRVADATLQRDATPRLPGQVVFDVEQAADGATMLVSQGDYTRQPAPVAARLRLARRSGTGFALSPGDDAQFARLNTAALDYAAGLSADGREVAFTRVTGWGPWASPSIWIARPPAPGQPFGEPVRIAAITGFAEAPSFSPDSLTLTFHRRDGEHFGLWQVTRPRR